MHEKNKVLVQHTNLSDIKLYHFILFKTSPDFERINEHRLAVISDHFHSMQLAGFVIVHLLMTSQINLQWISALYAYQNKIKSVCFKSCHFILINLADICVSSILIFFCTRGKDNKKSVLQNTQYMVTSTHLKRNQVLNNVFIQEINSILKVHWDINLVSHVRKSCKA